MDLSKLPRLSNTEKLPVPPPSMAELSNTPAAPVNTPSRAASRQLSNTMDAWLSIGIGLVLIFISPRIWQYLFSKCFHTEFTWTFTDPNGDLLPYRKTVFFPGDVAFALFACSMILEGIVIAAVRQRACIWFALILTVLATLLNLAYVGYMMQQGYNFQILPGLATAFGAYIAMYEWQLLSKAEG